jgi:hypothetical protein
MHISRAPIGVEDAPVARRMPRPELRDSLPCPRCQRTARRAEETEWLAFFRCSDCGWRFAKGRCGR